MRGLLVVTILVAAAAGSARAGLPKPLGDLFERVGVPAPAVDAVVAAMLPGTRDPGARVDPGTRELMERARREDVVVGLQDRPFDRANVELGAWEPAAFVRSYGTALFLAEPYDATRAPVFLVHGINGSPRDFADMIARFRGTAYQPVLFFYPTGMPLAEASRQLATRVQEFVTRHPTRGFAIVGHSMGGLVTKGVLDQVDAAQALPAWKALVAIASPWAGMPSAAYGKHLAGHPDSWDDLVPTSRFMRRVNATPLPRHLALYLFFGARGRRGLFGVLGSNDGRVGVDAVVNAPASAQARDVFGFYEDHQSILRAPRVFDRLATVLDREIGADGGRRR